ncbi:hypothetical protein Tco_1147648, partial [Tanacetum coccineum]
MIVVNNQRDSVSPLPLAAKPKKGKSQTVTPTLPKSQGLEGSEKSHSVSSGTVPNPQDLQRDIQLASTGLPSTLDDGTHKSQPLPEGKATPPKDSGGNIQPLDRDLTSTTSDEGTTKTTPRPEGKTSSEVESDTEPLQLQTFADIQAFLLSEDELDRESDEEEVLAAGEDMDEDAKVAEEVTTPPSKQDQTQPSNVQESTSDSSSLDLKRFDNTLPLTKRQLIKYLWKMSIVLFSRITEKQWEHNEKQQDQTDKLVEASMSSLEKSKTTINDLYKGLDVITQLLRDINTAVKDDPVTNKKIDETSKTFTKISTTTTTTEVLSLVKAFDFSTLYFDVQDLQTLVLKQEEKSAAWTNSSTNIA